MTSAIEKLQLNSKIKLANTLDETTVLDGVAPIVTPVPMFNVACSGSVNSGLMPGLLQLAGPSKHFKTLFGLLLVATYMKANPDAALLFYDSEFGAAKKYFANYGIDTSRVLHTPIMNVEELKHDIMNQLESINRGDKVIIFIDSIGNLASKKEVEDAMEGKQVADMTRAKALKSLGRMVTPHLSLKGICLIAINHTYKTLEMFSKDVVGGGTGLYYSANDVWIIGRQQDKDGKEVTGYHFIINIDKSRTVQEKSKIPIEVSFKEGIKRWSGLADLALAGDFITKKNNTWYNSAWFGEGKSVQRKDFEHDSKLWTRVLKEDAEFVRYIEERFKLKDAELIQEQDDED